MKSAVWAMGLVGCAMLAPRAAAQAAPAARTTAGGQATSVAQTASAADREVVRRARDAYYDLRKEGLVKFQCDIVPDYEALLADVRTQDSAAADSALAMLKQVHFMMSLGADDQVTVTHSDVPSDNPKVVSGLNQMYAGMAQMISGVFDSWSAFMLRPPFPAVDGNYKVEDLGAEYRLSFNEGTSAIVMTMGKDFAIHTMKVTAPDDASSLDPGLTKTPKGFMLTSYHGTDKAASATDTADVNTTIDYQVVDNLQLPAGLKLVGTYGAAPFAISVTFSGCTTQKR